jgi:hypothetical protein
MCTVKIGVVRIGVWAALIMADAAPPSRLRKNPHLNGGRVTVGAG